MTASWVDWMAVKSNGTEACSAGVGGAATETESSMASVRAGTDGCVDASPGGRVPGSCDVCVASIEGCADSDVVAVVSTMASEVSDRYWAASEATPPTASVEDGSSGRFGWTDMSTAAEFCSVDELETGSMIAASLRQVGVGNRG